MLTLFPDLLFLSPFAAFLIRLAIAATLGVAARRHMLKKERYFLGLAVIEAALALMLFLGFYTQAAALTALVLACIAIATPTMPLPRSTLALLAVMSFTLLLTGPGPFALDLPL